MQSKSTIPNWLVGYVVIALSVLVALITFGTTSCIVYWAESSRAFQKERYFNDHLATMPEIQEMYDLSLLEYNSNLFFGDDAVFSSLMNSGNNSIPTSLVQVTTELLFKMVAEQRGLKTEIFVQAEELREMQERLEEQADFCLKMQNEVRRQGDSLRCMNDVVQCVAIVGAIYVVLRLWKHD